jgi:hypothetical protein
MKKPDCLPADYSVRMHLLLHEAWRLLKSRFIGGRHEMLVEAPFQHYFADLISSVGNLHCTCREDQFLVDLETKYQNVRGKSKFVDIRCGFVNRNVTTAIELKFKTAQQGAQDHGRIDVYRDIEAVELVCQMLKCRFGKFYMITDSQVYVNKSSRGCGTRFPLHDGACVDSGERISGSKGRECSVMLMNEYAIEWEQIGKWYFLDLTVPGVPHITSSPSQS